MRRLMPGLILFALSLPVAAAPPCVNKFISRRDGANVTLTVLTGSITYEEAQTLSLSIASGKAKPFQWVSADGRVLASQFGEMKVVRPMPGGCNGKSSAVVVLLTFPSAAEPGQTIVLLQEGLKIELTRQQ